MKTLHALAALCLGLAGIPAAIAQTYAVTDLGVLPGYASCTPRGLNELGHVVGDCAPAVANFNQMGFVWKNGVMSATGKLAKGNYSVAMAINATGRIVGDGDTGSFRPESWTKTASGALVNIFPNKGGNTHALFVANTGWIGGYYTKSLSGNTSSWKGAIWSPDPKKTNAYVLTDLPVLPGGIDPASRSSIPSAFNQAGQAAGYASNDQIGQHAALWNNDAAHSIVDLGVYPGDWSSVGYGINNLGQVVGTSHPPFGSRPVMWNNDPAHTAFELPVLAGDNYGFATAINTAGHVIGGSYYGTPGTWDAGPTRLVVWRNAGAEEMQALLDPVSGAGMTLTAMTAINDAGQIVGTASVGNASRAVLLTPQ